MAMHKYLHATMRAPWEFIWHYFERISDRWLWTFVGQTSSVKVTCDYKPMLRNKLRQQTNFAFNFVKLFICFISIFHISFDFSSFFFISSLHNFILFQFQLSTFFTISSSFFNRSLDCVCSFNVSSFLIRNDFRAQL